MSSIRSTFRHRFRNTSPWFTLVAARSFFLSYIHDGAPIHLFVRHDLEPKPTQLSERLPGNASYSVGGIVRLTLTERIRFRYVRLRALEGNRFYRFSPDPRNSAKISASPGLSSNTSLQSGRHYERQSQPYQPTIHPSFSFAHHMFSSSLVTAALRQQRVRMPAPYSPREGPGLTQLLRKSDQWLTVTQLCQTGANTPCYTVLFSHSE